MNDFAREAIAIRRQMRDLHAKGYERISCAFGVGNLWELDRGARWRWKIVDAVIGLDGKSVFVKAGRRTLAILANDEGSSSMGRTGGL